MIYCLGFAYLFLCLLAQLGFVLMVIRLRFWLEVMWIYGVLCVFWLCVLAVLMDGFGGSLEGYFAWLMLVEIVMELLIFLGP